MVVAAPSMAVSVPSLAGQMACTSSGSSSGSSYRVRASSLRSGSGLICRIGTTSSVHAGFAGSVSELTSSVQMHAVGGGSRSVVIMQQVKPVIQFIRGIDERVVPDVKLTRSKDETNGVAIFQFDQPSVFDSSRELGDITGLYMLDEEGTLSTVDVSAKFVNGQPSKIEGTYVMRSKKEWDRFMRFMERYAKENQLGFVKS
ncbi:hypothetical protein M758_3G087500 [Ceratodon purpureus]|uniref:Photosystem II reaction center Psb28 protein n=1 Tax=Ceratodon purpureus TaxID=3225 RepID=A0A8T0IK25_CERPU|nr:hypothetical protein KC19_3G086300 [Ceratodon purpureus]KAG0622294.1 hypothetical protein M758_3G087500 [Ceratodon purpureus]